MPAQKGRRGKVAAPGEPTATVAVGAEARSYLIAGGKGRASDKIAALEKAGVAVSLSPAEMGETLARCAPGLVG